MAHRFGPWPVLVLLSCLALAAPARAADPAAICERAIGEGARRSGVPE